MVVVRRVDRASRRDVCQFIELPYRLYSGNKFWVPPLRRDARLVLDSTRHPFYERSEAEFFLAEKDGRVAGRLAVLENRPYNEHHGTREADFYCFECEDDAEVSDALFRRAAEWAASRSLTRLVGPKGFSPFDVRIVERLTITRDDDENYNGVYDVDRGAGSQGG